MSKVAFVIVTYNGQEYIEKCILSIIDFCNNVCLIVIDNNSQDNTKVILQGLPIYHLIVLK